MAVQVSMPMPWGETRSIYVRLNDFEQLANHDVPAIARFRGYVSKQAFEEGAAFVLERLVSFPANAPDNPWSLAYEALMALPEFANAVQD